VIGADIETTRSAFVVIAVQVGDEHEVISITKLNYTDNDVNERQGQKKKNKEHPLPRSGEDAGDKEINEKSSQRGINVGPGQVRNGGKKGSRENIAKKNRRA
jgi:hypothetical protein